MENSFLDALASKNFTKIKSLLCTEEASSTSKMWLYLGWLKFYDLNLETDMEIFDFLTKQDYISVLKNKNQETILHVTKSKLIVEYLSQYTNIDLDAEDSWGRTPLMIHLTDLIYGCYDPQVIEICTSLIKNGADLNKFSAHYDASPLHFLAKFTKFDLENSAIRDLFQCILSRPGLNINQPDSCGNTLLHLTTSQQMVEILLSHPNININAQNNKGDTPLSKMFSTERFSFDCGRLLINAGADMRITNSDGKSIMDMITRIPLLLEDGKQMFRTIMNCCRDQINQRARFLFDYMCNGSDQTYFILEDILALPFDNPHYMLIFKYSFDNKVELVYKKWDLINFHDLVDDLLTYFNGSQELHLNSSVVLRLWQYLELLHGSEMTNENYEEFFKNIVFPIFGKTNKLPTEKDLEKFLDLYLLYNVVPKFELRNIYDIFDMYGYCEALQAIIERTDFSEMQSLTVYSHPFLYSITQYCGTAANLWAEILEDTDVDALNFICIQDIARYYTMSEEMISFTNKYFPLHKEDLEKMAKEMKRPSKLLELSRDSARMMLREKYNARCPEELEVVLDELEIPPGIQDILMMRTPIYTAFERPSDGSEPVDCESGCRFCEDLSSQYETSFDGDDHVYLTDSSSDSSSDSTCESYNSDFDY